MQSGIQKGSKLPAVALRSQVLNLRGLQQARNQWRRVTVYSRIADRPPSDRLSDRCIAQRHQLEGWAAKAEELADQSG